jgi:glycosyltransferase involved in cell wall biosynthesis
MEGAGYGRAFVGLSPTNYRTLTGELDEQLHAVWPGPVEFPDWPSGITRAGMLARLVRNAKRYEAIVLDGSVGLRAAYGDLWAAAVAGRLGRHGPAVLVADATWKRGVSVLDRAALRAGIRLVDAPNVSFCVLTRGEAELFPRTWNVEPGKVYFAHWPHTLAADELDATAEGGVFAGGDSLRDYGPLVEAARGIDAEVTIATRRRELLEAADLPRNVRAGPLPHDRYVDALRRAAVVVVPMQPTEERGAGQTTYCNALAMGKLVIATDTLGVRDYIDDGETGVVVPPGDASALGAALAWATAAANAEAVARIAANARAMARDRLAPDRYVVRLLEIARTALERRAATSRTSRSP